MSDDDDDRRSPVRKLFAEPTRALDKIYFYTSNIQKYLQARLVFARHGLTVDYFKSKTDPYDEDYGGTTADLLTRAISQVTDQIGRGRLVFVEDTSLRVEALSAPDVDVPGMQVKHWFKNTTFDELDSAIAEAGGNRAAVVKSDIALKVPGLDRPLLFHGETAGHVVRQPPDFDPDPQHPWLTPYTFNGWFVPDGCDVPLGALSLAESLPHDFRVRAFEQLMDRLEEYTAALNLPPSAYRRKRTRAPLVADAPSLFDATETNPPALLAVGRTCAGKTTCAEYAHESHGLLYVEASKVVRSLDVEALPTDDPEGFAFAMRALGQLGHDVVPREIVRRHGADLDGPFVISGLRGIEEIRYMLEAVPRARIVLIQASERTRFERHVRRARPGAETTLGEFQARDSRQDAFGLLPVVDDLADVRVINEESMDAYQRQIDAVVADRAGVPGVDLATHPRHGPKQHQLYRCLAILNKSDGPLRCDEIESRSTGQSGIPIRHNNANKVLKAVPALAQRIAPPTDANGDQDTARVRYAITSGGVTYVRLFEARWDRLEDNDADA